MMGKDLLKHEYYLCDAREISTDHITFELLEPWYTISTFRFTKRSHLQYFMGIDFTSTEINPLSLIKRVE